MGIEDYNDIFSVLSEVKKLPSSLKTICKRIYILIYVYFIIDNSLTRNIDDSRTGFGDVIKWLNFLNLSEYTEKFLTNNIKTMERVKKLWEIELITVGFNSITERSFYIRVRVLHLDLNSTWQTRLNIRL